MFDSVMYVRLKPYLPPDIYLDAVGYHVQEVRQEGDDLVLKVVEAPLAGCKYNDKLYVVDDMWEEDDAGGGH